MIALPCIFFNMSLKSVPVLLTENAHLARGRGSQHFVLIF